MNKDWFVGYNLEIEVQVTTFSEGCGVPFRVTTANPAPRNGLFPNEIWQAQFTHWQEITTDRFSLWKQRAAHADQTQCQSPSCVFWWVSLAREVLVKHPQTGTVFPAGWCPGTWGDLQGRREDNTYLNPTELNLTYLKQELEIWSEASQDGVLLRWQANR